MTEGKGLGSDLRQPFGKAIILNRKGEIPFVGETVVNDTRKLEVEIKIPLEQKNYKVCQPLLCSSIPFLSSEKIKLSNKFIFAQNN